jgi:biopolymer transport protein ExbD
MGMNIGGGRGEDPEVMLEINTTPLVDVMLVLLVMLIITIPVQLHSVSLEMPSRTPPQQILDPVIVSIDITPTGQILWNGEALDGRAALEAKMQAAQAQADQPEIHVRPSRSAKYDAVAGVLATAQRLGLVKIGIVGSEQFAQ